MTTPVWLNDPRILLRKDKIMEIWPNQDMSAEEKVNAVSRLVIILVIIGYLLTLKVNIFLLGAATLGIVYLLYYFQNRSINKYKEKFSNKLSGVYPLLTDPIMYNMNKNLFMKPSQSNPLMNVTLPEIYYNPGRKPAAPTFMPEVETKINKSVKDFVTEPFDDPKIKDKLFADLGDELIFNRSMLQYNAMPNTQVPNDQGAFQEYLYGNMISAKEGNPLALERNHAGAYNFTNP
jgi:hypothetical protein